MATPATKTVKPRQASEPASAPAKAEPAANGDEAKRRSAVKLFTEDEMQVWDDVPENAKTHSAGGFTPQWRNDLQRLLTKAPEGKWVPVKEYVNASGARLAQRGMEPEGHDPDFETGISPVGDQFLKEIGLETTRTLESIVRRVDVPKPGAPDESERHSIIAFRWTA